MNLYNKNNKQVGKIWDNIYYTNRRPEHFMIKFQGFGISYEILQKLERFGVKKVNITYRSKSGKISVYGCELSKWLESKKEWIDNSEGIPDLQKFLSVAEINGDVPEELEIKNKQMKVEKDAKLF